MSGFTATNMVLPDDRAAVAVLTNGEASSAGSAIAAKDARLLSFPKKTLEIVERDMPDGRIEQFQVFVKD